jgi:dihydroorotate dehydrogenase electron transfer subunit
VIGPRTQAPFGRRTARVTANEAVGAYRLISALDSEGPADPKPGQFYMLSADERWGGGSDERPYLPRAFSFARALPGRDGVTLQFFLEAIGPGTTRLAELGKGEGLGLVGPLGIGFDVRDPDEPAILLGGGIGAAPLLALDDALDHECETMLGFRTYEYAEARRLFKGPPPQVATDDGSFGRQGFVTDLLRDWLEDDDDGTVYACGPPPMLEAVRLICAEQDVPAQLALESGMACGYGACFGCVVPTRNGYVRLCVDGPVVAGDELETALVPGAPH